MDLGVRGVYIEVQGGHMSTGRYIGVQGGRVSAGEYIGAQGVK